MEFDRKRGIDVKKMKKEVDEKSLKDYHTRLGDFVHSNPEGMKSDYWVSQETGTRLVFFNAPSRAQEIQVHLMQSIWIMTRSRVRAQQILARE